MHRLFFASFPDAAAAAAAMRVAAALRRAGVAGKWVDPARHHVTWLFVGSFAGVDDAQVRDLEAAAATVALPAFDLVLDHVRSFHGRRPPCVLAGEGAGAAGALSSALRAAVARAGIAHEAPRPFVPHLTLAYADAVVAMPPRIEPAAWRVRGFALVESVAGEVALRPRAHFALG